MKIHSKTSSSEYIFEFEDKSELLSWIKHQKEEVNSVNDPPTQDPQISLLNSFLLKGKKSTDGSGKFIVSLSDKEFCQYTANLISVCDQIYENWTDVVCCRNSDGSSGGKNRQRVLEDIELDL